MQSEHDLTRMMQAYGTQLLRLCTLYLKDRALAEALAPLRDTPAWREYDWLIAQVFGEAERV